MALTTTADVKMALRIKDTTQAMTDRLDLLRVKVEKAVKSWVKWELERPDTTTAGITEYHSGTGDSELVLNNPFVIAPGLGTPAAVLQVYVDQTGYYGYGSSAFAASTLQTHGTDYALDLGGAIVDSSTRAPKYAKKSVLRRLNTNRLLWPSDMVFGGKSSGLSYRDQPYWPAGNGNIKVVYSYGFESADIPDDIKLAVYTAIGIVTSTVRYGWPVSSEGLGDYNYSLAIARDPEFGGVRQLLAPYRDIALGSK